MQHAGLRVERSIAPTKEGQMGQAFENVKIALDAAQAGLDHVVSMNANIVDYTEADLEPFCRRQAPVRSSREVPVDALPCAPDTPFALVPPHFGREGGTAE